MSTANGGTPAVTTAPGPVLVTGVTGFIASRIVEQLLARGYRVRGTVRSLGKPGDIDVLRSLPRAPDRLELVEADLTKPGSFDAPARGCALVVHSASPYVITSKDPQRELVDPAVNGTREVLGACQRAESVRRVVLTSSMAAVTDEPPTDRVLTEADWNDQSNLTRNPYYYSKVLAERAAWAFMDQKPPFDLVAINPFMVIGPSLTSSLNTSNKVLVDLVKGVYPAIVSLTWGFVDVRDVADAHVRAAERPNAHGRYLCAGETMSMRTLVGLLAANGYGGHKLPTIGLDNNWGTAIMRLASYTQQKGVGSYLRTHLGRVPRYDTTKIRTELGVTFRPVHQTILDTIADLARWGHFYEPRRRQPSDS
jgi:nucleoside-diphosphate-sugar epimerase